MMHRGKLTTLLLLLAAAHPLAARGPVPLLSDAQRTEAVKILEEFRRDPRGPYGPIRWYCEDGRVLPPQGTPCRPGRGFQHAAPAAKAVRLAQMNINVARFLAGMPFDEFLDASRNHHWLRQMVMIDFLTARDDGWIYRRAWQRRGVRQAEDEERAARRLLTSLLADAAWVERHHLLAVQLGAAMPHGMDTSRTRRIRALSSQLADKDARFMNLRAKIHSQPSPEDIAGVEAFVAKYRPADGKGFAELVSLMRAEYLENQEREVITRFRQKVRDSEIGPALESYAGVLESNPEEAFVRGGQLALALRRALAGPAGGADKLELLDLTLVVLDQAFRFGAREGVRPSSRRAHLDHLRAWFKYATGAGLLSFRQLDALDAEINSLRAQKNLPAKQYHDSIRYLAKSLEWTRAAAAREFGDVMRLYEQIEPRSAELLDDLLRRSVALPLSHTIEILLADAEASIGRRHAVLGSPASRGVSALNAGLAIAPLVIVEPGQESRARLEPESIYVIPETLAGLKPVRGILTLDSGNALSHAQLLAANLGIPNATVPSSLLPELRKHSGHMMFYAVTDGGTVVLKPWDDMPEQERRFWTGRPQQARARVRLDTSRLDLADTRLRALEDVDASDSGRSVGPKAANLGQLAKYFPGRIAPGLVVPFGVFQRHIARAGGDGQPSLETQIREAYARAESMRASGASTADVRRFIYPKLAQFRQAIETMPLLPDFEAELTRRMSEVFGPDGSYGVFVRSDTNAEDLPGFSGAGLNLTVPNVVGRDRVIQALRSVWASPFAERAYDWRTQALESSERVLPSVLLLKTVAAAKSGVLVTVNLETLDPSEITVNVNEGVAAVVDGGVAESLLLGPDGSVRLLAQARAPFRRVAPREGGFAEVPTSGSDYVLQPKEIEQLRELVRDVQAKYPPTLDEQGRRLPWDIEFGFEQGQLRLFQIRLLVRFREAATLDALSRLEGETPDVGPVRLDAIVESP